MPRGKPFQIVGIDLAGSPDRPTGVCILSGRTARTQVLLKDEEILEAVLRATPDIVPIDAPLSLPEGRKSIHDRTGTHLRKCDRELQRLGIRFFPVTLGPMRMLTERGLEIKGKIEAMGYRPVECFPGGAQDVWNIPRKHHDLEGLRSGLVDQGVKGITAEMNDHELDAVSAALVGRYALMGKAEMLGGNSGILMPRII